VGLNDEEKPVAAGACSVDDRAPGADRAALPDPRGEVGMAMGADVACVDKDDVTPDEDSLVLTFIGVTLLDEPEVCVSLKHLEQ